MPSRRYILILSLLTFITICGVFSRLLRAQASIKSSRAPPAIGGRWQLVHASLGLGHFPATIVATLPTKKPHRLHRIDFRVRKRAMPAPLHFTHDALHKPRVSLKELVVSLRRTALQESKSDATRAETKKGRSRLGRTSLRKGQITPPP